MIRHRLLFVGTLLTCAPALVPLPTLAQSSSDPLVIPKIEGSIELDGRPDEAAWEDAKTLSLIQQRPNFGNEPTEKTEVLVGYTEDAIYFACRCYDRSKPSDPSFRRDYLRADSDLFGVLLDTFNDNENAVVFVTTPTGLRGDLAISGDAAGDVPLDIDWNSFWTTDVVQDEEGWFVEMRIPVSSLRFDAGEQGRVVMGFSLLRLLSRKNEFEVFPRIPPRLGILQPRQAFSSSGRSV